MALYNEGAGLFQEKDFQKARESYQAALGKAQALGDSPGIGFSLAAIGAAQQSLKEYDQALKSFEAALPYFKSSQKVAAEALTFAAIGEVQIQLSQDARAVEAFDQALIIAESLLKKASEQDKLLILGHREKVLFLKAQAYERLGNHIEALKSYSAAADDSKKTGNHAIAGAALWGAGAIAQKTGARQEAIGFFTEASSLLKNAGLMKDASWTDYELGLSYLEVGDSQKAVVAFSDVLTVAERERLHELTAGAHFGLGQAFERLSDFENALASYRSALRQLRAGNWKDKTKLEADTLFNMGVIHRWLSQYEEAIEHLRAAALKYQDIGNAMGQADTLAQLAEIFFWVAEPRISVSYYKEALEIYKRIGDLPKQIEVLAALGEAGYLTDEVSTEDGEKYFKDGQQLVASLTGFDPFARFNELSKAKTPSDTELSKIVPEWQLKLPSLNTEYRMAAGVLYQKWGRVHLQRRNSETARAMLLVALSYHTIFPLQQWEKMNREILVELAKDSYFLGEAFRLANEFKNALVFFRYVEQAAGRLRTPEIHFAYSGLARTYADLNDREKAFEYYKKGFEVLETVQGQQDTTDFKIGVFDGALYAYHDFLRLLLDVHKKTNEQRYLDESFEYNERMRARVFLEILSRSQITRVDKNASPQAVPQEDIRRKIAQIHHRLQTPKLEQSEETMLLDQLESLRPVWRLLRREIAEQDPKGSRVLSLQPATVANVQAAMDADAVLLEYATAYDGSILWAITKKQIKAYALPGANSQATLESYLRTLRQPLIGADEISLHIELGQKLYRELVEPAEEIIRQKKHLIIAPDGPLHYLPFEALIVSQGRNGPKQSTKLTDIDYLVRQYRVTYIPSASVLVAQQSGQQPKMPKAGLPLLAFGDPVYNDASNSQSSDILTDKITNLALRGQNLNRLEFSGDEVRRIARVWGVSPDSEHIRLRDRATVESLRSQDLSRYRILHFAAHAILGDQVKTLSQPALVLSQPERGNIEGGLLQFSDILDLNLNADLVVLSACETGLGSLRDGEGIVGLTRAFIYAGASSAVVSLWKVEDQSTSLLMERFHQNLKRGLSKGEALRQAKLDIMRSAVDLKATGMRQDLAAPFYWAPFILVGDWGPILSN